MGGARVPLCVPLSIQYSIIGLVLLKTQKMVLHTSFLNTQNYQVLIEVLIQGKE